MENSGNQNALGHYNIRARITDLGGFRRFFVVDAMVMNLNSNKDLRHINKTEKGITIIGHIEHEDDSGNLVNSLTSKKFSFTASDKLADPTNGRVVAPLIEDTNAESDTFGEFIPDPSFAPSVAEFALLAEKPTSGATLWEEVSELIRGYISMVQDYGRFN